MAKIPSIALIPSGYKATKIYSVLPVDGSADLTFDRGTSDDQTRVNSNGLIEDVAVDVPRLDYLDGGCPSLLLEPATTNLVTYSEDFSDASWNKTNATISSNAVISPKGDLTADKLVEDSSNTSHQTWLSTPVVGNDYSFSVFAKIGERRYFSLSFSDNVRYLSQYTFDLQNGVLTDSYNYSGVTSNYKIENYGNGWYRFELSSNYSFSTNVYARIFLENTSTPATVPSNSYLGDGTSGIYIWGAQLEEQSYATSYVPSLGTNGVRAAETASATGLSSYINSTEGVLYAETSSLANDGTDRVITLSNGTTSQRVTLFYSATSNRIEYSIVLGTLQASGNYTLTDATDFAKIALKYKENDFALYVNGLLVAVDTNGSTFSSGTLTKLAFDVGNGTFPFYGKTKDLRVYNEALSDLELARLSGFTSFLEMRSYLNYTAE